MVVSQSLGTVPALLVRNKCSRKLACCMKEAIGQLRIESAPHLGEILDQILADATRQE